MRLDALKVGEVEKVRQWRNRDDVRPGLRTSTMLTEEQQWSFYDSLPNSPHRYWAVRNDGTFLGMGGLTNIQWENGTAEISLILDPDQAGKGYGEAAVRLLLLEAFDRMRLLTVTGECYTCNSALTFWHKIIARYNGDWRLLPRRKWWDGKLWDATWFWFAAESWTR